MYREIHHVIIDNYNNMTSDINEILSIIKKLYIYNDMEGVDDAISIIKDYLDEFCDIIKRCKEKQAEGIVLIIDDMIKTICDYKMDEKGYEYLEFQIRDKIQKILPILCSIPINDDKVAFVAIVKNEGPYIREWIEFHIRQGVSRFYIYDNESTDNTKEIISDYIADGTVVYKYYPGKAMQYVSYLEAVENYAYQAKYMGFIDLDEFVFCINKSDKIADVVDRLLEKDDMAFGITINWRSYGSSGHEHHVSGKVTENYLYRAYDNYPGNALVKCICNPRYISHINNGHFIQSVIDGVERHRVNENGRIVEAGKNYENTCNIIRINHYFTKSKEDYIKKIQRGNADDNPRYELESFWINDRNEVFDDIASTL